MLPMMRLQQKALKSIVKVEIDKCKDTLMSRTADEGVLY